MNLNYLLMFFEKNKKIFSIMKITIFLLFLGSFQLFALDNQANSELNTNSVSIAQPGKHVSGKVLDANGEPIIGASVIEKGTNNGATTDANGNFSLNVGDNATLRFVYLGYVAQEVPVRNQTLINVTMAEDVQKLDELIVVGYGQQKKVSLTGAVAQVNGDDIASRQSADVVTAIQGMMPGVSVIRSSGQPGSQNSGLRIRGFTSVNGVDAMILIDGIEGSLTN